MGCESGHEIQDNLQQSLAHNPSRKVHTFADFGKKTRVLETVRREISEPIRAFVLWDDELIDFQTKWCKSEYDLGDPAYGKGWNLVNEHGLSYYYKCEKIYRDNSIWEEKIRFFYDFPELVEMRDFIRSNL